MYTCAKFVSTLPPWSASQVVLVVKDPPAHAGDPGDGGSIPGLGRSPGGRNGNPLQCSYLENPVDVDRGAWWLQSISLQRVRHDWSDLARRHALPDQEDLSTIELSAVVLKRLGRWQLMASVARQPRVPWPLHLLLATASRPVPFQGTLTQWSSSLQLGLPQQGWLAPGLELGLCLGVSGFPGGSDGKESACNARDPGSIPGQDDPPEKGIGTHSSILAWRVPWTEEPGGLQSMGLQRVGHDRATHTFCFPLGASSLVMGGARL